MNYSFFLKFQANRLTSGISVWYNIPAVSFYAAQLYNSVKRKEYFNEAQSSDLRFMRAVRGSGSDRLRTAGQ